MTLEGATKIKVIIWVCIGLLLLGVVFVVWRWGRVEFHAQRLGAEDGEVAMKSELALLSLGERGRSIIRNFLLKRLNIKLPPLSIEDCGMPEAAKIVAVSEQGEIEVAGDVASSPEVMLLADSSAPVEKVCRPLAELARTGTMKVHAGVLTPGSHLATVGIDIVFIDPGEKINCLVLRLDDQKADFEGKEVATSQDMAAFLSDKNDVPVKIIPRREVRYARLLAFAHCIFAAGRRPLLVFGDAAAFSRPALDELGLLTGALVSTDSEQQVLAAVKLKAAMGDLFVYDSSKNPSRNRSAIDEWGKWFEKNKSYIYYDAISGAYAYDAAAATAGIEHGKYWAGKLRIINGTDNHSNIIGEGD